MPVTETKVVKNRVHFDLTSGPEDRNAEIERILALGARSVDVGHTGDESWTVLADPEGNEFCVVRPTQTLIGSRELDPELAGRAWGPGTTGVRSERPPAPDVCHEMARACHASPASPQARRAAPQLPVGQGTERDHEHPSE